MWYYELLNERILSENNLDDIKKVFKYLYKEQEKINKYFKDKSDKNKSVKLEWKIFDRNDYEGNQLLYETYDKWWYIDDHTNDFFDSLEIHDLEFKLEQSIDNYNSFLNLLLVNLDTYVDKLSKKITDDYSYLYRINIFELCNDPAIKDNISEVELCKSIINPYIVLYDKFRCYYNKISSLHDNILFENDIYKKCDLVSSWFEGWILEVFDFLNKWEKNIILNWNHTELYSRSNTKEEITNNSLKVEEILLNLWVRKV